MAKRLAVLLWAWTAAAEAEDLVLDPAGGHLVEAAVNGVPLRLRVTLDAHGFVILNRAAARRAKLGRGDRRMVMAIGPVRLKGRGVQAPVTIGGRTAEMLLGWYDAPVDPAADGVISPGALPYDRVRLRYLPTAPGRHTLAYRVQFGEGDGLHVPIDVGGGYSIAVRFAPDAADTIAAGAAAAMMAETHGGTLSTAPFHVEIGFGITRPARWLTLRSPVRVGAAAVDRLLMRTSDFLGTHRLPRDAAITPDEILVSAARARQEALYRMTLGRDALGGCTEADYARAERLLLLRCP